MNTPSEPNSKKRKLESYVSTANFELIATSHPLYINFPYDSTTPFWDPRWQNLEQSFSPTCQDAWERVPDSKIFWDNVFHSQTIDMSIYYISKALKLTRKACRARLTAGITVHRRCVAIPHWVFNRFIWSRLLKEEKIQVAGSDSNTYKLQLTSLTRIAEIFGREHLVRGFSSGDHVIIAPRARVIKSWSPEGKQDLPEYLTVSAMKDEYVAVLNNFEESDWCWIWRFRETERCSIFGLDVQGSYGLFPKSCLTIVDPFSLQFRTEAFKLTLSFPFFRLNSCGRVTSQTKEITFKEHRTIKASAS